MCLMNVITAYLYGFLNNEIFVKIPKGFQMPKTNNLKNHSMYSIKLQRSLYGLKQSKCMWYNRFNAYLLRVLFLFFVFVILMIT